MNKFSFESEIDCKQQELFDWHERAGAFKRLCPHWEKVEMISHSGGIKDGAEVKLKLGLIGPLKLSWQLSHKGYIANNFFSDLQVSGPFHYWLHKHIFKENNGKAILIDEIDYKLPLGFIGNFFGNAFTKKKLNRLFSFRHRVTKADIQAEKIINSITKERKNMKILISGASGLVGKDLIDLLEHKGHQVSKLSRKKGSELFWNPEHNILDETILDGFDAIIHLGGENIANKRWTEKQKAKIKDSRINSTKLLANAIAKLKNPPKVFVCASAIGYYGDRPLENLNEESTAVKNDFLSQTCVAWEKACKPAQEAGVRVVNARFGIILSPKGGAMAKLLLPFQLGLGGNLGNGEQIMSWIALDDVLYALNYVIEDENISGAVNFTAPNQVSNAEFTKTLGQVLSRPTIFPVPKFACKLAFGEMADALLLSSVKAHPNKLKESSFDFAYPDLEPALEHLLGRN